MAAQREHVREADACVWNGKFACNIQKLHARAASFCAQVVEDFGLLQFTPLAIEDRWARGAAAALRADPWAGRCLCRPSLARQCRAGVSLFSPLSWQQRALPALCNVAEGSLLCRRACRESVAGLVSLVDKANGFVFAGLATGKQYGVAPELQYRREGRGRAARARACVGG